MVDTLDFEPNPLRNTVKWVHKNRVFELILSETLMNRISCGRPSQLSLATRQPCLCQDDSVQTGDGTYLRDTENFCFYLLVFCEISPICTTQNPVPWFGKVPLGIPSLMKGNFDPLNTLNCWILVGNFATCIFHMVFSVRFKGSTVEPWKNTVSLWFDCCGWRWNRCKDNITFCSILWVPCGISDISPNNEIWTKKLNKELNKLLLVL